eukprot:2603051-Heterocapsa_arctica.AAC.1
MIIIIITYDSTNNNNNHINVTLRAQSRKVHQQSPRPGCGRSAAKAPQGRWQFESPMVDT